MFEEPSSGSKATQRRPALDSSTMIGSSFSSETSTAQQCCVATPFVSARDKLRKNEHLEI